jgi:hypothetical protein
VILGLTKPLVRGPPTGATRNSLSLVYPSSLLSKSHAVKVQNRTFLECESVNIDTVVFLITSTMSDAVLCESDAMLFMIVFRTKRSSEGPPSVMPAPVEDGHEIDDALRSFATAKKYHRRRCASLSTSASDNHGPIQLEGRYDQATFEQLVAAISEPYWRLEFDVESETVSLYGDLSCQHEELVASVQRKVFHRLVQHVEKAPESGVEWVDRKSKGICDASHKTADLLASCGRRSSQPVLLSPMQGSDQHTPFPARLGNERIREGKIIKQPDFFFSLHRRHTRDAAAAAVHVPICLFECAHRNESIQVLAWEVLRGREAGIPVSLGIKVNVSEPPLAFFSFYPCL